MKVLVTGGAGFIGSHTVDALLREGHEVRVLDDLVPPVHMGGKVPAYLPVKDIEFRRGNVCRRADWERALEDVEAVFHFAAYQDYLPDFSHFFEVNAAGTALLYEVAVALRLPLQRIVLASSQAVYGEAKYACENTACPAEERIQYPSPRQEAQLGRGDWGPRCPDCGEPLAWRPTDEATVNPHNQYALSKYSQEMLALALGRRYELPTVALRYSIVQGARQSFRNAYSGVLRIFAQRVLNGLPPVCYEDGRQLRDYIAVHDVVRANLLALRDPRAVYQAFNVGGDRCVSVLDYAALVVRASGRQLRPEVPGLYRFGDTRHVISDVSKFRRLGWRPEVSLERVVEDYMDWVRPQPGFGDYSTSAQQTMLHLRALRTTGDA